MVGFFCLVLVCLQVVEGFGVIFEFWDVCDQIWWDWLYVFGYLDFD